MSARRVLPWLLLLLATNVCLADEKPQKWVEVRTPNFVVISNAGQRQAKKVAAKFERIRAVFRAALPFASQHANPVVTILAVKNEKSLQDLLPEYWATKGHMHPAGIFYSDEEKSYVALRTDVEGEDPYETIYHEYFHSLTVPYFPGLPLWFAEGLADFYANVAFQGNDVALGRMSLGRLRVVQESRFIPLETLFRVNHSSPYYNEKDKTSVFYAESWALTHYLMIGDRGAHRPMLHEYLERLNHGAPQEEAAKEAFGDLKKLGKELQLYVSNSIAYNFTMKAPPGMKDADLHARELSEAESEAIRGDFQVRRGRLVEAKPLLEDALRQNPNLGIAQEAMGWLHFRQNDHAAAFKAFGEAVRLDPNSYLAHYFHATLGTENDADLLLEEDAAAELRHSLVLNPQFAPAYSALAWLYARTAGKLPEALSLAQVAAGLEPGRVAYQLNVGAILLQLNRVDEALTIAQRALAAASEPGERAQADAFLSNVQRYLESRAEARRRQAEAKEARASGQAADDAASSSAHSPATARGTVPVEPRSAPKPAGRPALATGKITGVSCNAFELTLTLKMSGYSLDLHARNYMNIEFYSTNWQAPDNFNPCEHLNGLPAQIKYTPVKGASYGGEIITIDVRE